MARPQRGAIRAVVRISPLGRRMAVVGGRPAGLRVRRGRPTTADRPDWAEASFPMVAVDSAVHEILWFGAEIEVMQPPELRAAVADTAAKILRFHR
ncbi:MAG: WYL domain-containing protein [Ilumatobacteraceae bacterium]